MGLNIGKELNMFFFKNSIFKISRYEGNCEQVREEIPYFTGAVERWLAQSAGESYSC